MSRVIVGVVASFFLALWGCGAFTALPDGGVLDPGTDGGDPEGTNDGGLTFELVGDGGVAFEIVGAMVRSGIIVLPPTAKPNRDNAAGGRVQLAFGLHAQGAGAFENHTLLLTVHPDAGTYACAGSNPRILFQEQRVSFAIDAGPSVTAQYESQVANGTCSITLIEAEYVDGGVIRGTFEASLPRTVGLGAGSSPDAGVLLRNGVFRVTY